LGEGEETETENANVIRSEYNDFILN